MLNAKWRKQWTLNSELQVVPNVDPAVTNGHPSETIDLRFRLIRNQDGNPDAVCEDEPMNVNERFGVHARGLMKQLANRSPLKESIRSGNEFECIMSFKKAARQQRGLA